MIQHLVVEWTYVSREFSAETCHSCGKANEIEKLAPNPVICVQHNDKSQNQFDLMHSDPTMRVSSYFSVMFLAVHNNDILNYLLYI
jgi:hypothetical protein